MKHSIAFVVVAVLSAGTFSAYAESTESGVASSKARSTQHSSLNHRMRMKERADRAPSTTGSAAGATGAVIPEGEAGGSLQNAIRNCEEPAPAFCNRNY